MAETDGNSSPGETQRSAGQMEKAWKDQLNRNKNIYEEIWNKVQIRRKEYEDLDDLLGKRQRVISLTQYTPSEKRVEETDSLQRTHFVPKVFLRRDESEEAIEIALSTACRVHGSQEGVTKEDILECVKKMFNLTQKQVDVAEERTSQQPSKLQLVCKVMKASGLKPKQGDGTSERNPYCQVGIINERHHHPGSEFKYMVEWQKSGVISRIAQTSTRQATLQPVWNEDVELTVRNVEKEIVVIEVWDQPPLESNSKKRRSRSFKGNKTPNKEDFLGWNVHPLLLVPIAGDEFTLSLKSRGKKPPNGVITLFMSIQADTDNTPLELRLDEHHLLVRAVIDHFSKDEDGEHKPDWNGVLNAETEHLLEYHGVLNRLNKLQMASVRLSELLSYLKFETIDINAFSKVIKRMKQLQFLLPLPEGSVSTQFESCSLPPRLRNSSLMPPSATSSLHSSPHSSPRSSPAPGTPEPEDIQWVDQLFSLLKKLEAELMDTMVDHIRLVNVGFDGKVDRISPYLSALQELYTFKPFVEQMKPKKELRVELERCIEPSVDNWFLWLKTKVMPTQGSEPKELRDLCVYCLSWTEKVVEKLILHPTFTQAGVDYFTLYIMSLDEQLSEEVKKALSMYKKQKPDTITFEIYTHFQELIEMSKNADDEYQSELTILGFYKWFQEFVPGWIDVATEKCEARVRQAIELDEIVKITDELKLSASAVDTNGFLLQMATFWQHLDWPVASEAYGYAVSLMQNICNCANIFVEEVFSSLRPEDTLDDNNRFKASEKLCLLLNNMYHVREHLTEMPTHMKLDKLYSQLREEDMKKYELKTEGGPDVAEMYTDPLMTLDIKAKKLLSELLASADEDIMQKVDDLVSKICQSIRPDIQSLISQIVTSDADMNDEMAVAPLFDYLHQNLITLGSNLLPQVFDSITKQLWEISVEAIDMMFDDSHKKSFSIYHRLLHTLKSLREFYYCDGAGLSSKVLDSDRYSFLKSKLDILGMPTSQLIIRFYSDLLKQQKDESDGEGKLGELILSVGFARETSMVEVSVIHGDNIETLVEPYVKLRLSSVCQASEKHWKTKPVKGLQKAPVFNEDFKLPVSHDEISYEGSLVMFFVIDRKSKGKSPSGMCVLSCKKIPHIFAFARSSIMDDKAPKRKNSRLPLFSLSPETPALAELIMRAENKDSAATNFLKSNELLVSQYQSNNHPQRSRFSTTRKSRAGK